MKPIRNEAYMSNDARIAVLETTILNINSTMIDIRQDVKRLSDKVDNKIDALETKMDSKIDALEAKMDKKFDAVDSKFTSLEVKMDNKFESLNNRIWSNFLWLMSMMIGLAGLLAHTQHWI